MRLECNEYAHVAARQGMQLECNEYARVAAARQGMQLDCNENAVECCRCPSGKGVEDKRGESVGPRVAERGWLYLGGQAVVCSRCMEVVAMVSSVNPTISAAVDSVELGQLQQVDLVSGS